MRAMALSGDGGVMRTSLTSSDGGTGTTRILLVDDHEISRAAYRALLRAEGIDVVADLAASDHALAAARALRPDVAIVDVTPGADTGFGIARSLRALPDPPTVILTSTAGRAEFGPATNGYRFIAKADIRAAAIARLTPATGTDRPEPQNR